MLDKLSDTHFPTLSHYIRRLTNNLHLPNLGYRVKWRARVIVGVLFRHHLNHIFCFKQCRILQNSAYLTFISAAGTYFDLFQHHLVLVGLVHLEEIGIILSGKYQLVVGCGIGASQEKTLIGNCWSYLSAPTRTLRPVPLCFVCFCFCWLGSYV